MPCEVHGDVIASTARRVSETNSPRELGKKLAEHDTDSELAFLRSRSLTTVIQEKIERMILEGEFSPGQRLNEMAIAQMLGVSRSPVREACRKLEQAGLVEIINNRGMFVRSVDLQQALNIYDIRGALGELAGKLLVRHSTSEDVRELGRRVDEMAASIEKDDVKAYYRQNLEFHRALVEGTRNPRLAEMFLGTDKELHLYRQRSLVQPAGMSVSNQEHRAIVAAIESGDEERAGAAFRLHVLNGRDRAVQAATAHSSAAA